MIHATGKKLNTSKLQSAYYSSTWKTKTGTL